MANAFCYYALTFDRLFSPFPWIPIQASLEKAGAMSGGQLARQGRLRQAKEEFHHFPPVPQTLRDFKRRIPNYIEAEVKNAES